MSWKSKLLSVVINYNEKDAIKCAKLSDEIYFSHCKTKKTYCIKSNIPAIRIINMKNKTYVIFRGSKDLYNIKTNMKFATAQFHNVSVHRGFHTRFRKLKDYMYANIKHKKVICTGHSLGGAVASLAAIDLKLNKFDVSLYTFGTPKIGDIQFKKLHDKNIKNSWSFIHMKDPIVRFFSMPSFYRVGHTFVMHDDKLGTFNSHKMTQYIEGIKSQKYDLITNTLR